MLKSVKVGIALILASALPVLFASPAFAVGNRLSLTVDCTIGEGFEDDHNIAPNETLTITLVNCDGRDVVDDSIYGNATLNSTVLDPTGITISGASVQVIVTANSTNDREVANLEIDGAAIDIDVHGAGLAPTPDSTLLATETITLPLGAPEVMVREDEIGGPGDDDGDVYLGGNNLCKVEPGAHVYTTLDFTVTVQGEYQFIATDVAPLDEDLYWGVDKYPSSDPFLAVYQSFDPANPESGIVSCNDDADDDGLPSAIMDAWTFDGSNDYDSLLLYNGNLMDDQFPWFVADLAPGEYSMVYLPFSAVSTEDFDAGTFASHSDNSDVTWSPTAQSVTYDMWGPEGGIVFSSPTLPDTGLDSSFAAWTVASLFVAGATLMLIRRGRIARN